MVMEANKHDKNYMYENTDNHILIFFLSLSLAWFGFTLYGDTNYPDGFQLTF